MHQPVHYFVPPPPSDGRADVEDLDVAASGGARSLALRAGNSLRNGVGHSGPALGKMPDGLKNFELLEED